jgi:hypothetical protein
MTAPDGSRRLRRRWPFVVLPTIVVLAGVVWWGAPTGPTVQGVGAVGPEDVLIGLDGPGLSVTLNACNAQYDRIEVRETPGSVTLQVHGVDPCRPAWEAFWPWSSWGCPACADIQIVELSEPLGIRKVYDVTGWWHDPVRVEVYE